MTAPLGGIRVVDLTSYIAGSYGAMMLADLGADVIKVEAIEGDSFRELPGFYGWNRGKRSLALNLKDPDGCAVVHRLAKDADVVMENMRPGVVERLGVDYETLRALNPRIIYSTVTAFGSDGPYKERPGFDPLLQAMGGLMALQGFGGPPQYLRIAPTDYYCAALACQAVLAALFVRERTGRGQRVQTSLLQAVLALQSGSVVDYPGREVVLRETPTYRLYQGGDGEWFFLAVGNQSFWMKLCKVIGREDLARDPRFGSWLSRRDHADALMPLLEVTNVTLQYRTPDRVVTATRGERGRFDDKGTSPGLAIVGQAREAELRAAARELGVREVRLLEYIDGEIWANIWYDDRIARISPADGKVLGFIDLSTLYPKSARGSEAVLNGIAYDAAARRLFVTGKLWPTIFELRVR